MLAQINYNERQYNIDFSKPIDISIPLREGLENVNCFYAPLVEILPVKAGDFVGDTTQGGVVNFKNVRLNPHGNGTHTECVGHISTEPFLLDQCMKQYFFKAHLLSIYPTMIENGDKVITLDTLRAFLGDVSEKELGSAIIIRTLPNDKHKLNVQYSGTNPPYIDHLAMKYLVDLGIEHFLIDLPSVDREQDEGKLLAHKAFWQYPYDIREHCTITELIYVPDVVKDGDYFLNIQITSLQMDASPSKPVLFEII